MVTFQLPEQLCLWVLPGLQREILWQSRCLCGATMYAECHLSGSSRWSIWWYIQVYMPGRWVWIGVCEPCVSMPLVYQVLWGIKGAVGNAVIMQAPVKITLMIYPVTCIAVYVQEVSFGCSCLTFCVSFANRPFPNLPRLLAYRKSFGKLVFMSGTELVRQQQTYVLCYSEWIFHCQIHKESLWENIKSFHGEFKGILNNF